MHGKHGSRRASGYGKALDTPPKDREKNLTGKDQFDGLPPGNKPQGISSFDYDGDYGGNVFGCCSKPVSLK